MKNNKREKIIKYDHLKAVAKLMSDMQQLRIFILHFPSVRNNLLAQCLDDGKEAMKKKFLKATLEEK